MKQDFHKAAKTAALYARRAMVVTLSFDTVTHADQTISAADIRTGFVRYLQDRGIPHAIILEDEKTLTFATAREKEHGEPRARAAVAGYFKGPLENALTSQAYFQEHTHGPASDAGAEADADAPVITIQDRREIARNLKRFRRAA